MSPFALRSRALVVGAALVFAAQAAFAQTTINLHTTTGNCVAVTNDAAGVTSVPTPGSTALQVNGVTLSESPAGSGACSPVGGSSSDFNVQVSVSTGGTPAIGTPFNVTWSASHDARTCVRTGSANVATGISGWVIGSTATCNGSGSCGATEAVTPTAAGTYSFGVTCTNSSGTASATAPNVPAPAVPAPTPNPIPLTATLSTAAPGALVAVTFPAMTSAAQCVGSGTLNDVAVANLGDWTTAFVPSAIAQNSRNVTIPSTAAAGDVLKLSLTCNNSDHSATASSSPTAPATITVAIQTGACPATITPPNGTGTRNLMATADVKYGIAGNGVRSATNFSQFDNIWGFNDANVGSTVVPWPGVSGSSPYFPMSRTGYFGAHFKTGTAAYAGKLTYGNYGGTIPISVSISTTCGDFAGDPATNGCYVSNHPSDDSPHNNWQFGTGVSPYRCYLQANTDYYLNVMFTDPHPTDQTLAQKCPSAATTCTILLKSFH